MMDDDLKGAFRELREHDRERAPGFDALVQRPLRRRKRPRLALILAPAFGAGAVACAAAIVLWIGANRRPPAASAPVVAATVAVIVSPAAAIESEPLGFLLDVPSIGTPDFDSDPKGRTP